MEHYVFECINILETWEQRILLTLKLNGNQSNSIELLISDYESDSLKYDDTSELPHSLSESTFFAIRAVSIIRNLILSFNDCHSSGLISAEFTEMVVMNAFQAGFSAGKFLPSLSNEAFQLEYETKGIRAVSKKAVEERHQPLRDFKQRAAVAIKIAWESGANLNHSKMAKFMAKEYVDSKGEHPFAHLPGKGKNGIYHPAEKVLREVAKAVATEIGRRDLVSGLKKIKNSIVG